SMLPRISVTPQSATNPDDPFATPFTVKNDGFLPLYDVKSECAIRQVQLLQINTPYVLTVVEPKAYGFRLIDPRFAASVLDPNSTIDMACPFQRVENKKVKNANIALIVSFRPSILPWLRQEKFYPFVTGTDQITGQIHWFSTGSVIKNPK
ncbi:MAG: hypothetical protein WAK26_09420, partial [Terracidiphilus sp.]